MPAEFVMMDGEVHHGIVCAGAPVGVAWSVQDRLCNSVECVVSDITKVILTLQRSSSHCLLMLVVSRCTSKAARCLVNVRPGRVLVAGRFCIVRFCEPVLSHNVSRVGGDIMPVWFGLGCECLEACDPLLRVVVRWARCRSDLNCHALLRVKGVLMWYLAATIGRALVNFIVLCGALLTGDVPSARARQAEVRRRFLPFGLLPGQHTCSPGCPHAPPHAGAWQPGVCVAC